MTTDASRPLSTPAEPTEHGIISGMRPSRREDAPAAESVEPTGSVWAPAAAVSWLLALTPAAVIAAKAGFFVAMLIAVIQVLLIVLVLMRFVWRTRIHLLVLGIGVLFGAMLMAMISFDRSQYRIEVERFDTTVRGAELRTAE